jgi:ribonuclease H2 subunit C
LIDGKTISYFRGRKLHGKKLKVPKGYRGAVISSTGRIVPKEQPATQIKEGEGRGEEEGRMEEDVKVVEEVAEFEELVVWGHEAVVDEGDAYVRGVEEWVGFAETVSFVLY